MDKAQDKFGITFPWRISSVVIRPPSWPTSPAELFGKATILGTPCQYLAFSTDKIDWQLWVQDGAEGLPRKLVITYKPRRKRSRNTLPSSPIGN